MKEMANSTDMVDKTKYYRAAAKPDLRKKVWQGEVLAERAAV